VQVDQDGKLVKVERFWDQTTANAITNPIDCKVGPDGALYFLDWADNGNYPHNAGLGNLVKLEYTGPADPVRPATAPAFPTRADAWTLVAPGARWTPPASALSAEAFDPQGRRVWSWSKSARSIGPSATAQVLRVRVDAEARP
jgi:hypothetical protein